MSGSMSETSTSLPIRLGPLLRRGLRKRCPHCGEGAVLDERERLRHHCEHCGYEFERRGGDLFFFLYVGAGAITFVFIVVMYTFRIWSYGWEVRLPYLLLGIGTMIGLMSRRMGVAVALDYLSRVLFETREEWDPEAKRGAGENAAEPAGTGDKERLGGRSPGASGNGGSGRRRE